MISNIGTWMQNLTVPFVVDQLTHSTAFVGLSAFCAFAPRDPHRSDRRVARRSLRPTGAVDVDPSRPGGGRHRPVGAVGDRHRHDAVDPGLRRDRGDRLRAHDLHLAVVRAAARAPYGAVERGAAQFDAVHGGPRRSARRWPGSCWPRSVPQPPSHATRLSFLVVIGALLMITPRPPENLEPHRGVWHHFLEGIRYMRERQVMVVSILLMVLMALLGVAMVQLVEPFARHVLDVGPGVYGLLIGGYGIGAVTGGLVHGVVRRLVSTIVVRPVRAGHDGRRGSVPRSGSGVGGRAGWALLHRRRPGVHHHRVQRRRSSSTSTRGSAAGRRRCSRWRSSLRRRSVHWWAASWGSSTGLRLTIAGSSLLLTAATCWALVHYQRFRPLDVAPVIFDHTVPPASSDS